MIQVEAEPAREMARRCAREEGILVGISSGATLAAIAQKLPELPAGARVLGFNYDTGERYLSIEGFLPALKLPSPCGGPMSTRPYHGGLSPPLLDHHKPEDP